MTSGITKQSHRILYKGGQGEIIEKKSRFIAKIVPVNSEEEALTFIEEIKKQNWNANHNCYAYTIGDRNECMRCSDDGEPSQTAGKPMLDVLTLQGIHNVAAVVTRYFGGTLLGTGGLVRAYSKAVQEGLLSCVIIEKSQGKKMHVRTDYNGIGKIQYLLGQRKIKILDSIYTETVSIEIIVPIEEEKELVKEITEVTNGNARIIKGDMVSYAVVDGEVIIL